MATSLGLVQIHHLYVKRFHTVKRMRKSVQYIWRYATKMRQFFGHVVPDAVSYTHLTLPTILRV